MSRGTEDVERVAVSTYVPAYQRERWRADADRLGMSQSEFVRTMVQAGRSGFDLAERGDGGGLGESDPKNPAQGRSDGLTPGGDGLKNRVVDILSREEVVDWEALVAGVTGNIEDRLEESLADLQSENRVQYSGRHGGYRLVGDGE